MAYFITTLIEKIQRQNAITKHSCPLKNFLEHKTNPELQNTVVPMSSTMSTDGQKYLDYMNRLWKIFKLPSTTVAAFHLATREDN